MTPRLTTFADDRDVAQLNRWIRETDNRLRGLLDSAGTGTTLFAGSGGGSTSDAHWEADSALQISTRAPYEHVVIPGFMGLAGGGINNSDATGYVLDLGDHTFGNINGEARGTQRTLRYTRTDNERIFGGFFGWDIFGFGGAVSLEDCNIPTLTSGQTNLWGAYKPFQSELYFSRPVGGGAEYTVKLPAMNYVAALALLDDNVQLGPIEPGVYDMGGTTGGWVGYLVGTPNFQLREWTANVFNFAGERITEPINAVPGTYKVYDVTTTGWSGNTAPVWPGSGSVTANSQPAWAATTAYTVGKTVRPISPNGEAYRCIVAGTSGGSEPVWSTTDGTTLTDGTVTWRTAGPDTAAVFAFKHTLVYPLSAVTPASGIRIANLQDGMGTFLASQTAGIKLDGLNEFGRIQFTDFDLRAITAGGFGIYTNTGFGTASTQRVRVDSSGLFVGTGDGVSAGTAFRATNAGSNSTLLSYNFGTAAYQDFVFNGKAFQFNNLTDGSAFVFSVPLASGTAQIDLSDGTARGTLRANSTTTVLESSFGTGIRLSNSAKNITFDGNLLPLLTTYDIGTSGGRWRKLWIADIDFSGTITGAVLASLNGLTGSTQTFAVGTTGSDFNIASSGTTHTFHIPDASNTGPVRGLVSTGTQSFAGAKTFNGAVTVEGLLTVNTTGMDVNAGMTTRAITSDAGNDITSGGFMNAASGFKDNGVAGVDAGPFTVITSITVSGGIITAISGS